MTFKLHCFGQSGNAYKDALFLQLSGADWEPVFVDFMNGAHRQPEFVALNEMAQVPVLEHDGKCISQSAVILEYLVEQTGKFGWANDDERREVMRWLFWDNYSFTSIVAPCASSPPSCRRTSATPTCWASSSPDSRARSRR